MRISDWISDVCSSDLLPRSSGRQTARRTSRPSGQRHARAPSLRYSNALTFPFKHDARLCLHTFTHVLAQRFYVGAACATEIEEEVAMLFRNLRRAFREATAACRSEEHTSELQSLMRISSACFCLTK